MPLRNPDARAVAGFRPMRADFRFGDASAQTGATAQRTESTIPVVVLVGDWTPDSTGYRDAPRPEVAGGTGVAQRALVAHNLGTETAMIAGYIDASGRYHYPGEFVDAIRTSGNTFNSITLWLDSVPSGSITVLVQAY